MIDFCEVAIFSIPALGLLAWCVNLIPDKKPTYNSKKQALTSLLCFLVWPLSLLFVFYKYWANLEDEPPTDTR